MPGKFLALALILTGLLASLACSNASGPIGAATPTRLPTLTANPTPTATLLPSPSPTVNSSDATEPKPEHIARPASPATKQPATLLLNPQTGLSLAIRSPRGGDRFYGSADVRPPIDPNRPENIGRSV